MIFKCLFVGHLLLLKEYAKQLLLHLIKMFKQDSVAHSSSTLLLMRSIIQISKCGKTLFYLGLSGVVKNVTDKSLTNFQTIPEYLGT